MTAPGTDVATVDLDDGQWDRLYKRAQTLAKVSYVPEAFRGKPDDIMAVGLAAQALGHQLTPLTLQQFYVVKGRVDYMYQLVAALLHEHGHELWVEEESPESATVAGRRRGSDRVHRVTITMADANRAGLPSRNPTYKAYPSDMLVARAGKRCAKRVAPEVMLGLPAVSHHDGNFAVAPADAADDDVVDAELVETLRPDPGGTGRRLSAQEEPAPSHGASTGGPTPQGSSAVPDQLTKVPGAGKSGPTGPAAHHEEDGSGPSVNPQAEPARTLASQIAMQAQRAGLDRAHVIAAATGGRKTSAREVDTREGAQVLRAIAEIAGGYLELAQVDGVWVLNEAAPAE